MRRSILVLTLLAIGLLPSPATAEASSSDLGAESRALVQRLVLDRAAAVAAAQRAADEREQQLFAELAKKDAGLRSEMRTRKAAEASLGEVTAALNEVTAERQRLVDQIASRDLRFAADIAEYRRQVASIADSPDPRKREALRLYAEGDRAGGFGALVEIQKAETKAVTKAEAGGWREIAALALDRKDRGEMSTAEVIPLFETAQKMDADSAWGAIELSDLYREAGRPVDARRSAEQALAHSLNDQERVAAEGSLETLLLEAGDLAGARSHLEASQDILARRIFANPTSAPAQRDMSISLIMLGEILVKTGELMAARDQFEGAWKILAHLADLNPTNAEVQRDLGVSLLKLGDVLVLLGDRQTAHARLWDSVTLLKRLADSNPSSARAQRDAAGSLSSFGDVLVQLGDLKAARTQFEDSVRIAAHLADSNPSNTEAQEDLSLSLIKLGKVLIQLGDLKAACEQFAAEVKNRQRLADSNPASVKAQRDLSVSQAVLGAVLAQAGELPAARTQFESSMKTAERLAAANPSGAEDQRALIASHVALATLPGEEDHWREALQLALELRRKGLLDDAGLIEELRKHVAAPLPPP
jgi:tetratricopeptide (TPR) repeat protein